MCLMRLLLQALLPFPLLTALLGMLMPYDSSLTFLSAEALVERSISLGRYLPKDQFLTYVDGDPGMMKIHSAEWGV